jgi:dolichol-phosphate mannosyltransferase
MAEKYSQRTVYYLIPIYNEEENLLELSRNLQTSFANENKVFVFSDDGSKDLSLDKIDQYFSGTEFIVLGDGNNYGPGHAFNIGFEWILKNHKSSNDVVITLEADNTSDIKILPKLLGNIDLGFDLVLASVYAQGGGFSNTSFFRKILSFSANMVFRMFFDIKVLTLSSFYRAYTLEILINIQKKYGNIIVEKGFISMLEILQKAINTDGSIIEVPMFLNSDKRAGKSKMKVFNTALSYIKYLINFRSKFKS